MTGVPEIRKDSRMVKVRARLHLMVPAHPSRHCLVWRAEPRPAAAGGGAQSPPSHPRVPQPASSRAHPLQDVMREMLQSPRQHYARLTSLLRRIKDSPEASQELMRWGLSLDPDIHRVGAAGCRGSELPLFPGTEATAALRQHRSCHGFLLCSDPGPSPARGEDQPAAQLLHPRRGPELEQGGHARSLHLGGEPTARPSQQHPLV